MLLPDPTITIMDAMICLNRLDYWFDTDQEILDAMSDDERRDHENSHGLVQEALDLLIKAESEVREIERRYVFKTEGAE